MSIFEEEYRNVYFKQHKEILPPGCLDPDIFYFNSDGGDPILLPTVKLQILNDIDAINSAENSFVKTRVFDYVLTGPIMKRDCSKRCPVNIIVQIDTTNLTDVLKERILNTIKSINNRLVTGTQHPLVYIPTIRKIDFEKYEGVYHPFTEKWIKRPGVLKESKHSIDKLHRDPAHFKKKKNTSLNLKLRKLTSI